MADEPIPKRDERLRSDLWRRRVGQCLKFARERRKLTQAKLAKEVGVDWTTISNIERGESAPDLVTMETIADVLGASLDELVGHFPRGDAERRGRLEDALPEGSTPLAIFGETVPRLPEALREVIEELRGEIRQAMAAANNAQATADEAKRLASRRGRKTA